MFQVDSHLGQAYADAMTLAGEYAYAGRDVVVDRVLEILGARATYEVHNHHNDAWRESTTASSGGSCARAAPRRSPASKGSSARPWARTQSSSKAPPAAEQALFSTVHGAGRAMSRTQAAGKSKRRNIFSCPTPGCDSPHQKGCAACAEDCESLRALLVGELGR